MFIVKQCFIGHGPWATLRDSGHGSGEHSLEAAIEAVVAGGGDSKFDLAWGGGEGPRHQPSLEAAGEAVWAVGGVS